MRQSGLAATSQGGQSGLPFYSLGVVGGTLDEFLLQQYNARRSRLIKVVVCSKRSVIPSDSGLLVNR